MDDFDVKNQIGLEEVVEIADAGGNVEYLYR